MLAHGIPPDFRGGVHSFKPLYAIGSVPGLSGHAISYRWRILPRVRRYRANSHEGGSSNGCCRYRSYHGPVNVHLSFHTHTVGMKGTSCKYRQVGESGGELLYNTMTKMIMVS